MKDNVWIIKEREFITKEFADTLAGKTPAPYLRLHESSSVIIFDMRSRQEVPLIIFITPALT
jgi:hypothetical protein